MGGRSHALLNLPLQSLRTSRHFRCTISNSLDLKPPRKGSPRKFQEQVDENGLRGLPECLRKLANSSDLELVLLERHVPNPCGEAKAGMGCYCLPTSPPFVPAASIPESRKSSRQTSQDPIRISMSCERQDSGIGNAEIDERVDKLFLLNLQDEGAISGSSSKSDSQPHYMDERTMCACRYNPMLCNRAGEVLDMERVLRSFVPKKTELDVMSEGSMATGSCHAMRSVISC